MKNTLLVLIIAVSGIRCSGEVAVMLDPGEEHTNSSHHREAIIAAAECACFYCLEIFSPSSIVEWTDFDNEGIGQTAMCPNCRIDSVIPVRQGVDSELLEEMKARWF